MEMFSQQFIQNAVMVSIVMGVMLAYLGIHVVGRGIVFVDLALGQISMLGIAVGNFIEKDPTTVSILFTMTGAFLLSFIKIKDQWLKQEAIIGIVYAVASALTVLFIAKSPHGESGISEVLFGSVFTVTGDQISAMAAVFGIIGIAHWIFRKKFFGLTEKFANHEIDTIGVFNLWNFLFYLSIGLAIVLAVRSAGVIPVFSYLIIPPVSALMLTRKRTPMVVAAFLVAVLGSIFGIYFSVAFDFPAGASVVTILGLLIAVAAAVRWGRGFFK